jgi:hypothetical protein
VSLALGHQRLEEAGNLQNLREAARGETRPPQRGLPVFDSDIYKWLEAVGWELGRRPDELGPPFIRDLADDVIKTLRAAQSPDGYVGSSYRVSGSRFSDMLNGLELYCAGHLFEAAVAWQRSTGDDHLLTVAARFADHIGTVFGSGRRAGIPEHPGIEMCPVLPGAVLRHHVGWWHPALAVRAHAARGGRGRPPAPAHRRDGLPGTGADLGSR